MIHLFITTNQLTYENRIQCRYLASTPKEGAIEAFANWKLLEKRNDHNNNLYEKESLDNFIPGGGIAQKFYKMRFFFI